MRLTYRQLMNKSSILLATVLLTLFTACEPLGPHGPGVPVPGPEQPLGPQGNGQGYERKRNLIVEKNLNKQLNLNDMGATGAAVYALLQAPAHGSLAVTDPSNGFAEFTPAQDYIGPDFFIYERKTEEGSDVVGTFVDIVPCFRIPTARTMNENLHVVATSFANSEIDVHVEKGTAPITLVLSAESHAVHWRVTLGEDAEIAKVVLHDVGTSSIVDGLPSTTQIVRRVAPGAHFWEPVEHFAFNSFSAYIEGIRDLLGENEATFQGCQNLRKATIPLSPATMAESCGSVGINYAPYAKSYPSHYRFADQQCTDKCRSSSGPAYTVLDATKKSTTAFLSADRLTASSLDMGGLVRTESGPKCGKYYYEVRINNAPSSESIILGLARESSPVSDMEFGLIYNGSDLLTAINNPQSPLLVGPSLGDVIGVALDLDAGVVYFSKNGVWQKGGDPGLGTGGSSLGLYFYEPVLAGASVIWGGGVTFNFGGSAFSYSAPAEYRAGNLPPL